MDLRHMRHFVAVAEELNFRRAADRLRMTQPPLSQSIRRLETDLGLKLLNRTKRSVELTEVGRAFLVQARRTLLQADFARKAALRAGEEASEIRISFMNAALYDILPRLVARHRERQPNVSLKLFEMPSPGQVEGLLSGDYDFGIILPGTPHTEHLDRLVIESTGFLAAVPDEWPIAQRDSVTLAELCKQPFIRPPERVDGRLTQPLALFEVIGMAPDIVQEVNQINTMLSLIGAGLGCGIVTASASHMHVRGVKFLTITDHPPDRYWQLQLVWNPDNFGTAAQAFLRMTKDLVSQGARAPATAKGAR
ncbi:LysR substrate-binding domain-containing protein [Novosphingobium pentaromativorans]|nr:LysR substrate-binding domain-containing protein [Novosphingobium pentaromativorans]